MRRFVFLAFTLTVGLLCPIAAQTQGSIAGIVLDPVGAAAPKVGSKPRYHRRHRRRATDGAGSQDAA